MMSGISEDSIWRHPLDRKISRGQFRYDFHRGALGQVRDKGRQFYVNRTDEGVFEYLGVTEAINFYFGIDYSNVSNFRAMERGTRIHSYIEQGIRDNSFEASLSKQDWEALSKLQLSNTGIKKQQEDIAFIKSNYERITSEMGYANRILDYISKNYPASKGWKVHSEYLVSDFMNYASSIDILCTNERTKEAVILDLKTGTIKEAAVNAQTGIYKHFLKNDPRYQDYTVSLGAITIDKQLNKVNVLPLTGISEDQAHDILYPASSFNKNSIWYKNKAGIIDFSPGYGNPKKETKIVYDIFSPDTMRVNPLDGKVVSDMFHRVKPKREEEKNKPRKGELGDIVSFDIETLPLSNGTMSLRSFSIFNFTAYRNGRQMKLKYSDNVDERAFLSTEAFTNKTSVSLKQRAIDALEKNLLSDEAVKMFEEMHGRQATVATSQDILDIMDKLTGKTVIGHNLLNFDFPQLLAMGKRLAKAEGGETAYRAFKNRFEAKLSNISIIDTYELAKELRYKSPNLFSTITVEALIEKLSPSDASKIKGLLHQSSADVLATAKIFEILFNTLPQEEVDFLYKIIKDTKQGKHYTVTSKFETDSKIQRVGNKKGELRAMDVSAYGPVGFDLHRTTHWILGEEKTIGGITYKRYDDARKYDREYNEYVSNAITNNQVIIKPMVNGKGYYLTVNEEDNTDKIVSYTDFTKAALDLKELMRKQGVALFKLPGVSENGKGTPGEYIQRHGFDKSPEHWVMLYDTDTLADYNRMPAFIRAGAHKRFNFVRSLFGGVLSLGRNIVNRGTQLLGLGNKEQKRRKFINFDNLVDAYIKNLTLQKSDTVIKYKRGYWKMAGELDALFDFNEKLQNTIENQQEHENSLINAGAGLIASLTDVKALINFGDTFHKYSIEELSSFQQSKAFASILNNRLKKAADREFIKETLAAVLESKRTAEAKAALDTDLLYTFDVTKGLSSKSKEALRPLFMQVKDQNPYLASKTLSYVQKASALAKSYGFKDDVVNDVLSTNVSHFLMEGETPLKSDVSDVLSQLQSKSDFYARSYEVEAGFDRIRQLSAKYRAREDLLSNLTDKIAATDAGASLMPSLFSVSAARRKELLNNREADKNRKIQREEEQRKESYAYMRSLFDINKETASRRFNAERFISQNIMFSSDKKKLIDATNAAEVSSEEYAQTLNQVHDNTVKLNRVLGATVGTLKSIPFYNPDQLFAAGYHQIGSIHKSLTGVIPNFLNTSVTKMLMGGVQDYELGWQKWKYGIKNVTPALSLVGGTLGAVAGAPFGASVQMGAMGASAFGGLGAWATQLIGNRYERAINETGLFFSSRFNKMGAMIAPAIAALNLFTKALKIASVPLLAGLGSGLYMYKRALNNMGTLDTPLYNLTDINYGMGYNQLSRLDYTFGMKRGTTNNIIEGVEFAKQGLLSLGRYDKNKLISSALLGIFNEAYMNPGNGASNYAAMTSKLYENYQNSKNKGRFMYLLNEYNPELAKQLQIRTEYESFLASDRGAPYRNRQYYYNDINRDQRNEFRAITGIQSSFGESIQNSFMKIAAALYNWKGFDFMNRYTSVIGNAADAFAGGDINGGFKIIGDGIIDFIDNLGKTWAEVKEKLGMSGLKDTILTYGKIIYHEIKLKLIDLGLFVTDIFGKIKDPAKGFFMFLYEQFKKLFDFVGQIRLNIDLKKLAKGDLGGLQFRVGYKDTGDVKETWHVNEYGSSLFDRDDIERNLSRKTMNKINKAFGLTRRDDFTFALNSTDTYNIDSLMAIYDLIQQEYGKVTDSTVESFITSAVAPSFNWTKHSEWQRKKVAAYKIADALGIEPASAALDKVVFPNAEDVLNYFTGGKDIGVMAKDKLEEAKEKETKLILEFKNDQGKSEQHELIIGQQTGIVEVFGPNWKWGVR